MTISEDKVMCGFEGLEIFVWLEKSAGRKGYSNSDEKNETCGCYVYHFRLTTHVTQLRDLSQLQWSRLSLTFTAMSALDLTAYQEARAALIHEDRYLRRDMHIKHSDAEKKADQIIRDIRTEEASTIWMQEHESILHPFPGMEFLTGASWIIAYTALRAHISFL
jgi:hypothetical protein